MNSLERIVAAVKFEEADRVPVVAQVFGHAGVICGVPLEDYIRDGQTLARCQIEALRRYGYDAVFSVMDANVETEAVGSVLRYRMNHYPTIERYAMGEDADAPFPEIPDPEHAGRMPEMLRALRILRAELGDEVLIVGCVLGPFTLMSQLLGLEKTLYMAIDDLPRLERILDYATEVVLRFGEAQMSAGAHLPLVFDPAASPSVVPPRFFRELELPRLKMIFQGLAAAGAIANWLHVAGPVRPILSFYPNAGVNVANFDYCVDPAQVREELPNTCVDGNIRSLAFVDSDPAKIASDAQKLLGAFGHRGGFILSSGCEIPPEAAPENVAAMVGASRGGA